MIKIIIILYSIIFIIILEEIRSYMSKRITELWKADVPSGAHYTNGSPIPTL